MVSPRRPALSGQNGFLHDTPSRYDAILARRKKQSLNSRADLSDDASENPYEEASRGRASSAHRRRSSGHLLRSESPFRDRRATLDVFKIQSRPPIKDSYDTGTRGVIDLKKRTRSNDAPPLPPAHPNLGTPGSQGSGSYYSRKQQKVANSALEDRLHYPCTHTSARLASGEDGSSEISQSGGSFLSQSPNFRRKGLTSSRSIPYSVIHEDSFRQDYDLPLSQLSTELEDDENPANEAVEDAGLHSQVQRMKQRISQLEKEKMDLSMSMAPLEARIRQKEETWLKEQAKLIHDIDALQASLRGADERFRDLEVKFDDLQTENKQLRMEARKASQSQPSLAQAGWWTEQIKSDRDLDDTRRRLRQAEEEIDSIRLAKVSVEKELHATKIALSSLTRKYDELQSEYDAIAASSSENNEAEIKLGVLTAEHMATSAQLNAVCVDLAATKARAEASMKAKDDEHKKKVEELQFEMSVLKSRAGKIVDEQPLNLSESEEDDAVLRARIEERDRHIAQLKMELQQGEQLRRQMHNCIQELRGNIRVFVRTRPFLPGDRQSSESPIDVSPDGESLTIMDPRNSSLLQFKFDKVFPPSAGQDTVFDEVSDFVQSALDGYNVCLFSYGQTGSGKTHTMQGCGTGAMRGIIPRAVEKILSQAKILTSQKWDFNISASFLEIYNEELKDLLFSLGSEKQRNVTANKLSIKRTKEGKSFVDGLTETPIEIVDSETGAEQLSELMAVASRSRSVASTKMNAQSSRSHSVFILHLRGINNETGAIVHGTLNLCDLAGSERLDRSGAGSDQARLKETQAINKSLSCLGDVFNALATGSPHIPFRNSKLTYLLQDCLSGDGKALMMVNMSPTTASSGESVCSLRFAQRVNQVELGKATKNIQYNGKGRSTKTRQAK